MDGAKKVELTTLFNCELFDDIGHSFSLANLTAYPASGGGGGTQGATIGNRLATFVWGPHQIGS